MASLDALEAGVESAATVQHCVLGIINMRSHSLRIAYASLVLLGPVPLSCFNILTENAY